MIREIIQKIDRRLPAPAEPEQRQKGQSIIILAFAFLGLIAMLGLALDLGLVYIERVRLRRAVDAAVLAGVTELPFESQAFERALQYLDDNGYPVNGGSIDVYFAGCWPGQGPNFDDTNNPPPGNPYPISPGAPYPMPADAPRARIILDTYSFQDQTAKNDERCNRGTRTFGMANKLSITGTIPVRMNFMQFFGFREVPVTDNAIAQNVTSLDVAVVFDRSGSMEFDTICYGCWTPSGSGVEYPGNGAFHPIPFDSSDGANNVIDKGLCTQNQIPYQNSGNNYLIMEAELYYRNNSLWDREFRQPGQGFWAIQRNNKGTSSIDGTGTYVSHHPFPRFAQSCNAASGDVGQFYSLAEAQNGSAPMLEYAFTPPNTWSGNIYVWLRVQSGPSWWACDDTGANNRNTIYWQLTGPGGLDTGIQTNTSSTSSGGENYDGAQPDRWQWIRLNAGNSATPGQPHHLKIWAGSVGYDIDKIVITNDTRTNACQIEALRYPLNQSQCETNVASGRYHRDAVGRPATQGSAYGDGTNATINSLACDVCNPIFGKTVDPAVCRVYSVFTTTNHLGDDLFSDEEPVRSSKEAIKNFIKRLDPQFDQVGFIYYSDNAIVGTELECRKLAAQQGLNCYQDPNPISYTNVLAAVEGVAASGSTNLGEGMRDGIEVLGTDASGGGGFNNNCTPGQTGVSHCGRLGAATRVLIIMTDGQPNRDPGGACDDQDIYQPNTGDNGLDEAADCVIFYAREADAAGITIYAIGLGQGADQNLLKAAAEGEGRNGQFFFAPSPADLDAIFEVILQNIYVRLIS